VKSKAQLSLFLIETALALKIKGIYLQFLVAYIWNKRNSLIISLLKFRSDGKFTSIKREPSEGGRRRIEKSNPERGIYHFRMPIMVIQTYNNNLI